MKIYLKMSKMYVYFINIYYIYYKNIYNIYRLYIYKTIGAFYCFVFSFLEVVYTAGNDEYDECCAVCFCSIIYSSKCLYYCKYYIHYRLACLF